MCCEIKSETAIAAQTQTVKQPAMAEVVGAATPATPASRATSWIGRHTIVDGSRSTTVAAPASRATSWRAWHTIVDESSYATSDADEMQSTQREERETGVESEAKR